LEGIGASLDRDLQSSSACLPITEKVAIEDAMNVDVSQYCNGAPNCKIVVRVEPVTV
jgi:hypothetical protein